MSRNTKIRVVIILAVTLVCVYGIIGLPTSKAQLAENWKNNIRLGTDLQGGSNLVYQIQMQDAFKGEADTVIQRLRDELAKALFAQEDGVSTWEGDQQVAPTVAPRRNDTGNVPRKAFATAGLSTRRSGPPAGCDVVALGWLAV